MEARRVFIVGDSLFAETLVRMLDLSGGVQVVGVAPTPEAALSKPVEPVPDALNVASTGGPRGCVLDPLLAAYPDPPIILADLNAGIVRVVESRLVNARGSDLLAVIAGLPKQEVKRDA